MKQLKTGDRIRLKVRTLSGWKRMGTVTEDQVDDAVVFQKDDDESGATNNVALRHQVALIRSRP